MRGKSNGAFGLTASVAVVTGAGSGIGRAVAAALAAEGARLALLDRNGDTLDATAASIRQAGGECHTYLCDVSNETELAAAARTALAALGPAEILVNNAGMIRPGSLADLSLADWNAVLGVNLTGFFLCACEFGAQMREAGRGSIVNMASIASTFAAPFTGAYSVSKAGVAMLSRQLAVEWGPDGVRSNAVYPGMILTEFSQSMYERPGVLEARSAAIPSRRIGQPGDIGSGACSRVGQVVLPERRGDRGGWRLHAPSAFSRAASWIRAGARDLVTMTRRIAVIGAGAAGLCAAKHLKAKGFEVTIFELGSRVGGLWVYGNDNGTSPAYASLHCNSEARVTAYRDFPFPLNAPLYPDHRQMTAYFESLRRELRPGEANPLQVRSGQRRQGQRLVDGCTQGRRRSSSPRSSERAAPPTVRHGIQSLGPLTSSRYGFQPISACATRKWQQLGPGIEVFGVTVAIDAR
jgi:NAD(P)-dependent dehydrogenase (short-subunit alcohol dehydrogenase family)